MKFRYTGVTKQKENVSGVLEAQDEIEVKMRLRAMQVRPLQIARHYERKSFLGLSLRSPINLKGLSIFTRQFSSLIDSGVPVSQCFQILLDQETRPHFKRILVQIKEDIEQGAGLAEAMGKHRNVFSEFYLRVVEAGEISGTLDTALRRVGVQLEKLGKLKSKVINAMTYPMITLVAAILTLVFMLVKVIPAMAELYKEAKAPLPDITVFVLGISGWFESNFVWLLLVFIFSVVGFSAAYKREAFREKFDPIVLHIPLFGSLILRSSVARFARTMGTLIASGVPLLQSFTICLKVTDNRAIRKALSNASSAISEGKSMAQGIAYGGVFPTMVVHMINVGETTGRLDELLGKVAEIYDDEVDDAVQNLTGVLQPLMIVGVGVIIAFLMVAMYLPIFQLADKVTGAM